jgi:hypothetical protein
LTASGTILIGSRSIPFRDCKLMHQDEFLPRAPLTVKKKSAKTLLAKAGELLKSRKSKFEDIDYRELYDEEEAHDDDLQRQLETNFLANLAAYEKMLVAKFGPPTEAGPGQHDGIPINGLLRHVVWVVGKKSLYLAISHEDRELPWVIYLGVTV